MPAVRRASIILRSGNDKASVLIGLLYRIRSDARFEFSSGTRAGISAGASLGCSDAEIPQSKGSNTLTKASIGAGRLKHSAHFPRVLFAMFVMFVHQQVNVKISGHGTEAERS